MLGRNVRKGFGERCSTADNWLRRLFKVSRGIREKAALRSEADGEVGLCAILKNRMFYLQRNTIETKGREWKGREAGGRTSSGF